MYLNRVRSLQRNKSSPSFTKTKYRSTAAVPCQGSNGRRSGNLTPKDRHHTFDPRKWAEKIGAGRRGMQGERGVAHRHFISYR